MCNIQLPDCIYCGKQISLKSFKKSRGSRKFCSHSCYLKSKSDAVPDRHCRWCGGVSKWKKRSKFCSKECCDHDRAWRLKNKHVVKCATCNLEFKTPNKSTRYCSKECKNKVKPRNHSLMNCEFCGVEFCCVMFSKADNSYFAAGTRKKKFCSKLCEKSQRAKRYVNNCIVCNNDFITIRVDYKNEFVPRLDTSTCGPECTSILMSKNKSKENHPNWRGGSSEKDWRGDGWFALSEKVRERSGRICESCGKTEDEEGRRLSVNHIRPWHTFPPEEKDIANRIENLEALCMSCHRKKDAAWFRENDYEIYI